MDLAHSFFFGGGGVKKIVSYRIILKYANDFHKQESELKLNGSFLHTEIYE